MKAQDLGLFCGFWATIALVGCNHDRTPMSGDGGAARGEFRGAIPADFQNTRSPEQFDDDAGQIMAKLAGPLRLFSQPIKGLGQNDAALVDDSSKLPSLARCASVASVAGTMMDHGVFDQWSAGIKLAATAGGGQCAQLIRQLGVAFPGMLSAASGQAAGLRHLTLAGDDCVDLLDTAQASQKSAAVTVSVAKRGGGSYLAAFDIPKFTGHLVGGSDGTRVAMKGEVEMTARSELQADGTKDERYQWAGVGSIIDDKEEILTSERRELWQLFSGAGAGRKMKEMASVISNMTLGFGLSEIVQETTTWAISDGGEEKSLTMTLTATPAASSGVNLDVKIEGDGKSDAASWALTPGADADTCVVAVR